LNFGADIVLHSTTKYINGHSDSLGGALVLNDDTLFEKLKFHQNAIGSVLSPFDSYLSARGLKTLELRMNIHSSNAMEISKFLKDHEKVKKVYYPGLEEHEGHRIARMQMKEFGGMLSFRYKGETKSFLKRLKYFYLAESLGGIESLIEVPYYMTHSSLPMEERIKLGIDDKLIRVSVGIENIEDLLEDLQNSL
jgi:cystathionine gamma-lyase (EC 4.4.1.1)